MPSQPQNILSTAEPVNFRPARQVEATWIRDDTEFEALGHAWNGLAVLADPNDIFLRFEWFDAAWQWLKTEAELRILVVRRDGQVIGIVPLVLHRGVQSPWRQIGFLAVPDTQRCGMVCEQANLTEVADALGAALRAGATHWDELSLQKLSRDSAEHGVLTQAFFRHGLRPCMKNADENPYIDVSGEWQAFYASRSRSLKKASNLAANRLAKAGQTQIEQVTSASASMAQAEQALDHLIQISARSWKKATGTSLDNPGPGAFIRRLTKYAMREGWLSLWLLRLNGEAVATEYQLVHGGRIYALRADFDKNLEDISPGSFLNRQMLEKLFSAGLKRYLMGPGHNRYKRRWTDVAEPLVGLCAYSPSLRGGLRYLWIERLRPKVKRIMTRVKPTPKEAVDSE